MTVALTKDGIDLGIVTNDGQAALKFYRDTPGLKHEGDMTFPVGGTIHRLWCGGSLIKIVVPDRASEIHPARGPVAKATGFRYLTISVSNIQELTDACRTGGYNVVVEPTEIRPGVTIAMVDDPDGNRVEFMQTS